MTIFEQSILTLLELITVIYISIKIQDRKVEMRIINLIALLLGAVSNVVLGSVFTISEVVLFINLLITFFIIKMFIRQKVKESMITFMLAMINLYFLQLFTILLLNFFIRPFLYTFTNGMLSQLMTILITVVVSKLANYNSLYYYVVFKNRMSLVILSNLFFVYIINILLWHSDIKNLTGNVEEMIIVLLLIIVINMVLFYNGMRNQTLQKKYDLYDTYIPIVNQLIDEIRLKQHDYHNHIGVINAYINNHNISQEADIAVYTRQLNEDLVLSKLLKLDNRILVALLYSKYRIALSKNVHMNIQLECMCVRSILKDYDLVEIFGILLDNSIDAAVENHIDHFELRINSENGINTIQTTNKIAKNSTFDIEQFCNLGYTSKSEIGHGLGLYKLKRVLKVYSGDIFCEYDEIEKEIRILVKFS